MRRGDNPERVEIRTIPALSGWFPMELLLVIAVLFIVLPSHLSGQETGEKPVITKRISVRPILVDIEFEGNTQIDARIISQRIQSRATSSSGVRTFFRTYAELFEKNSAAPQHFTVLLQNIVDSLSDVRYLNVKVAGEDTNRILNLYNDYGYHNARVDFEIDIDTARNSSILRFIIDEGPQYNVRGVRYQGLEQLPETVRNLIVKSKENLQQGKPYTKDELSAEITRVRTVLQNNGYAFARQSNVPTVIPYYPPRFEEHSDSVIIYMFPGKRYKFGETFLDSDPSTERHAVDDESILCQVEYKEGEWYDKRDVDQTSNNLYQLRTFDVIRVDTASDQSTDETLAMRVTTRLRKFNDLQISVEGNQGIRGDENVFNAGLGGSYTYLNLFGGAEQITIGGKFQGRLPNFSELEWGANAAFKWPSPFCIQRLTATLPINYNNAVEDRESDATLNSERISISPELSYRLPQYTLINLITGRASYQYTSYSGVREYITAKAESRIENTALDADCDVEQVRADVIEELQSNIYRLQVLQGDDPSLIRNQDILDVFDDLKRTFTLSITGIGDHRNNFFSPTDGYFFQTYAELGITGGFNGAFLKLDGDARIYRPAGHGASWAARGHIGTILRFGDFPLVPLTSRYWAGGANSIRGWSSREMLVTSPPETVVGDDCSAQIIEDILRENRRLLGGLFILEFSGEYRTRLFTLPDNSTFNQQLNQLIGIFFLDMGNAYFRNYQDDKALLNVEDIITNIGIATGVNIGYDSPVGPVRFGFGWPLYDPVNKNLGDRWFWQRSFTMSDFAWQISIGHAF